MNSPFFGPESGLSEIDREIGTYLRTTTLRSVEIQAPDMPSAMEALNAFVMTEHGCKALGLSYVICVRKKHDSHDVFDPFGEPSASPAKPHYIGRPVSLKMVDASLEAILTTIASQSGLKMKLSNGIVFY